MAFKFEKLEVWQLALTYIDLMYEIANHLPPNEEFNLKSQIRRAATSVALNIAEGSTGQSNREQARFLGLSVRSLIETVACQRIIARRQYLTAPSPLLDDANAQASALAAKLHSFRRFLVSGKGSVRDEAAEYPADDDGQ